MTGRLSIIVGLGALAVAVLAVAPFVGLQSIPVETLWHSADDTAGKIFWVIRVPRVLAAFLAGAALALSGMTFQALFRNPLATPYTLGVASGASLGAVVYIHLGLTLSLGWFDGGSLFAFAGAMLTIGIVYALSRTRQGFSTATLLLSGVALNFFFSSLILFVQYLSDPARTFRMFRWMLGGLEGVVGMEPVAGLLPFVLAGTAVVAFQRHELNLLATGEDLATARGVEVKRTKALLLLAASLMVGSVAAVCGPIGFVGLMAPHICRLLIGPDHRLLAPATLLFGGTFLVLCDTAARTVIAPYELPVGIITALLGGPFFLWLLMARSSELDAV